MITYFRTNTNENKYYVKGHIRMYDNFSIHTRPFDVGSMGFDYPVDSLHNFPIDLQLGDIVTNDFKNYGIVTKMTKDYDNNQVLVDGISLTGFLSRIQVFSFLRSVISNGNLQYMEEESNEEYIVSSGTSWYCESPEDLVTLINNWIYGYTGRLDNIRDISDFFTFEYVLSGNINPSNRSINDILRYIFSKPIDGDDEWIFPIVELYPVSDYYVLGLNCYDNKYVSSIKRVNFSEVSDYNHVESMDSKVVNAIIVSSPTQVESSGADVTRITCYTRKNPKLVLGANYEIHNPEVGDANSSLSYFSTTYAGKLNNLSISDEFEYKSDEQLSIGTKVVFTFGEEEISGFITGVTVEECSGVIFYFYDIGGIEL